MYKKGIVAIWFGYFKNEKDRNDFFELIYEGEDEDDDKDEYEDYDENYEDIYSKFTKTFKIDEFDTELYYYYEVKGTNDLTKLILEFDVLDSKEDIISYVLKNHSNPDKLYNTAIMFTNFEYENLVNHYKEKDFYIDFFCNTEFGYKEK